MNNATTTSVNDDFDALMEASSLGSPRVTAAIGSAPPDARQRFEHAARSPEAYIGEPQASPAQGATSRPHALGGPGHPTVRYGGRPTARVIMVSATGSGKTRTFLSSLQHTDTAATAACNEPPAHPRVSLVSRETMAAVLCAAYDVAEEAGLWRFPAPGRLTALLAARLPALAAPLPVAVEPPASMKLDIAPTDRTPTGFMESAARIHMRMLLSLSGNPDRHTDRLLLQRVRKPSAQWRSANSARSAHNTVLPLCAIDDELDRQMMASVTLLTDSSATQTQLSSLDGYVRMQAAASETFRRPTRIGSGAQPDAQQRPWNLPPANLADSMRHGTWEITRLHELWNVCCPFPQDVHTVPMAWSGHGRYLYTSERLLHSWGQPAAGRLESVVLVDECHSSRPMLLRCAMQGLPWLIVVAAPSMHTAQSLLPASEPPGVGVRDSGIIPVDVETPLARQPELFGDTAALSHVQVMQAEITGRFHVDREGSRTLPLPLLFRYRATDPYVVEAVFGPEDTDVTWVFARDLLAAGMHAKTGDGDVTIRPSLHGPVNNTWIYIELKPPREQHWCRCPGHA